jgi:hypothetical protein
MNVISLERAAEATNTISGKALSRRSHNQALEQRSKEESLGKKRSQYRAP